MKKAVLLLALLFSAGCYAQGFVLVAKPGMKEFYEHTVIAVIPDAHGTHVGFILNKPTKQTIAQTYPDFAPASKVNKPFYLGGPEMTKYVFAAFRGGKPDGVVTAEFLDGIHVAFDEKAVDYVIEHRAADAKFFAGVVVWQPGELDAEMSKDLWYQVPFTSDLMFRSPTDTMWQDLIDKIRENKV